MIYVENVEVSNFSGAIRGMRNPLESWSKSDSEYVSNEYVIGTVDLDLAKRLISSGSDHSKFMRQIFVSMDITAPIYWWKEMDTYKVATVANSTSTMHKLMSTPITLDKLSIEPEGEEEEKAVEEILSYIESLRKKYVETKDKHIWRLIIQLLPSGWNQTRTWTANYQTLRNIYFARKNHKLSEWLEFCEFIESMPYSELITLSK